MKITMWKRVTMSQTIEVPDKLLYDNDAHALQEAIWEEGDEQNGWKETNILEEGWEHI